ncbi:MAG: hypothetical protein ACRDOH_31735 [Streptosporangiaceae bacterium]
MYSESIRVQHGTEETTALLAGQLDAAYVGPEITSTNDPDASSLASDASQAESLGLLKPVNLSGIFDLGPLNTALAERGEGEVGGQSQVSS